jgi:glycosyltransferase involved in cell wall biosynthesis
MTSTTASELDPVPERGSTVICIPVAVAGERTLATIRAVLEHSDPAVPILLAGAPASIERLAGGLSAEQWNERLSSLAVDDVGGLTEAVNQAMRAAHPADLALVAPGCVVTTEWLERMREAATSDSVVASATALSIGRAGVELFAAEPGSPAIEQAAREVRDSALRLRPRIATMGPGCVYVRRAAWDLAGPLDGELGPESAVGPDGAVGREGELGLDGALEAMARRLTGLGLIHVAADDVLVAGRSGEHEGTCAEDESPALRRSLDRARTTLRGLSVTIDGRSLTAKVGGTQTYAIELILALAREPDLTVRVLIAPDISQRARDALASAPGIELLTYEQAIGGAPLSDVVHRPQQVFTPDDMVLLRLVGRRVVVGQQDLIAYHNLSYHPDVDIWHAYRRTTRLALAGADQVVFFSEHARRDALCEDLVAERRAHVVGIGADTLEPDGPLGEPPCALVTGEPFLLCLGAGYAHKNRPFAIELLRALREQGWGGRLVLCGARVAHGSSREREAELLASDAELARLVVDLGPVDEAGKRWLYSHARALLYPTLYEGFGLIPLEAARAGLPCLFAAQASLAELAPEAATLVPWDATASARAVLPLLSDGPARETHLARLGSHSVPSWTEVAGALRAVYEQALAAPPAEAAPRVWEELGREQYIVRLDEDIAKLKLTAQEYQDAYHALSERVDFGLPLIDRGGLLSKAEQRGLMRIASRRGMGALALAPFGLLGRGEDHT